MAARRSFASWGTGSSISLPIRIEGERSISVGRDTVFGEGCWLQTDGAGVIEIGDDCHFSGYAVISATLSIVVESHVIFARNVHILDHNHRIDLEDIPIRFQGETAPEPVRIMEGSWVGANVVILPGVTVGRGAVIAANSIVRDDVRDRVIVAGAPAREIRRIGAPSSGAFTPPSPQPVG
jgi:acetyltransferase-like isoleucine patch superfamily enzyme